MHRHRAIAAAPARDVRETWTVVAELITATLASSRAIARGDVAAALTAAAPAAKLLIAGGHLDTHPIVLVASPVHLSITTISGTKALESSAPPAAVPGGGTAETFTLYLPTPAPLEDTIAQIARTDSHLSAAEPPEVVEKALASEEPAIDREALRRLLES